MWTFTPTWDDADDWLTGDDIYRWHMTTATHPHQVCKYNISRIFSENVPRLGTTDDLEVSLTHVLEIISMFKTKQKKEKKKNPLKYDDSW